MTWKPAESRWSLARITARLAAAVVLTGCGDSATGGGESGSAGASGMGAHAGISGAPAQSGVSGSDRGGAPSAVTGGGGSLISAGSSGTPTATGGAEMNHAGAATGGGGARGGSGGVASGGSAGGPGLGGTDAGGASSGAGGVAGAAGLGGSSVGGGGAGNSAPPCPPATPLTGGRRFCSNSTGNAGGNYSYELWAEGSGSGCMTVYGKDATFGATWTNVEDLLARVGLQFDRTRKHGQIGTLSAEFAETQTGGETGLVYVGIYGWTVNPLREFYILDDWGATKPAGIASDGTPRDKMGEITVDGEVYDVWKKTRMNKPAITGNNMTFDQYFSIRRSARQCGHISISEHFSKWEELGLPLGNLTEAKLLIEAQDSTGTIEFTTAIVRVE